MKCKKCETVLEEQVQCCQQCGTAVEALPKESSRENFIIDNGLLIKYEGKSDGVRIPQGVTKIKEDAFFGCDVPTWIYIPSSVTEIEEDAFDFDIYQVPFVVEENSYAQDYLRRNRWDAMLFEIKHGVLVGFYIERGNPNFTEGELSFVIPDIVTEIGEYAFDSCPYVGSVTVPSSVKKIGQNAFSDCSHLESVILADSVTEIGKEAFKNCESLLQATLSNGLTKIPESLFEECESLETIQIPNSVTEIGKDAFSSCISLQKLTISGSVKKIHGDAFDGCDTIEDSDSCEVPAIAEVETGSYAEAYLKKTFPDLDLHIMDETGKAPTATTSQGKGVLFSVFCPHCETTQEFDLEPSLLGKEVGSNVDCGDHHCPYCNSYLHMMADVQEAKVNVTVDSYEIGVYKGDL